MSPSLVKLENQHAKQWQVYPNKACTVVNALAAVLLFGVLCPRFREQRWNARDRRIEFQSRAVYNCSAESRRATHD